MLNNVYFQGKSSQKYFLFNFLINTLKTQTTLYLLVNKKFYSNKNFEDNLSLLKKKKNKNVMSRKKINHGCFKKKFTNCNNIAKIKKT